MITTLYLAEILTYKKQFSLFIFNTTMALSNRTTDIKRMQWLPLNTEYRKVLLWYILSFRPNPSCKPSQTCTHVLMHNPHFRTKTKSRDWLQALCTELLLVCVNVCVHIFIQQLDLTYRIHLGLYQVKVNIWFCFAVWFSKTTTGSGITTCISEGNP